MKLTARHISAIAITVTKLPDTERPTWDSVIRIAKGLTRHTFSRQALEKHGRIKNAYSDRVDAYRKRRSTGRPEAREGHLAPDSERELRTVNEDLKGRLEEFDRRLILLIGNATARGISLEQLEAALPRRNRGWSDGIGPAS